MSNLALAVRALRSRNYRLFFCGQIISLIGTWMTRVATSWLVYRLTDSALLLGVVGFAGQIPNFLLGPIAGVWVDRWDRRRTLVWTQTLSMVQSFALAYLALTNTAKIWEIIALAVFQGVISAFDMPARQSFVIQMVDRREDLLNAIALNGTMVNSASLVGPAVAGAVVAAFGEGYCFLIDGISYCAVIMSLLAMRIAAAQARAPRREIMHEIGEGWQYVRESKAIRSILTNLGLVSMFAFPYFTLMPLFAVEVLHGGPNTLGFLTAAVGVGALIGTVSLTMRQTVEGLAPRIGFATALAGIASIAFGFSHLLWVSILLLPFLGFGMMQQMAPSNTILQTIVHDDKRGRVMSFYGMAFLGMVPFGSLLAGFLASHIGAPRTMMLNAAVCILASVLYARRLPAIHEVVAREGNAGRGYNPRVPNTGV
jgi:MFS family permease